jgi:predicted phosphate transport protein (TIGR00153 family)
MGFWEWLASRREKEVLKLYDQHIDEITKVTNSVNNLLTAFREGDKSLMENEWRIIFESERKADDIKRRIIRELSEEFVHPIDREELIRLILATDDIATFAKEASRMALLYNGKPPLDVAQVLLDIITRINESVMLIREAVSYLSIDKKKTLEISDKIERLEEEVDDLRHKGLSIILARCNETGIPNCLLLKDILEYLENSADKTEDVADELRSIAVFTS